MANCSFVIVWSLIMWHSVHQKLGWENGSSQSFVSGSLYPTQSFKFPIGKSIRFRYLPVGKWRCNATPPTFPLFPSGKLGILSGMETIVHKQLGAPIFPSQFPTHRMPHNLHKRKLLFDKLFRHRLCL